jgi:hypothetical protein
MESQVTLVEIRAHAHAVLAFDQDSMRNTTLRLHPHAEALYTVRSSKDYSSTELRDAQGALVARLQFREILADLVTFRDRPKQPIAAWLKSRKRL